MEPQKGEWDKENVCSGNDQEFPRTAERHLSSESESQRGSWRINRYKSISRSFRVKVSADNERQCTLKEILRFTWTFIKNIGNYTTVERYLQDHERKSLTTNYLQFSSLPKYSSRMELFVFCGEILRQNNHWQNSPILSLHQM